MQKIIRGENGKRKGKRLYDEKIKEERKMNLHCLVKIIGNQKSVFHF